MDYSINVNSLGNLEFPTKASSQNPVSEETGLFGTENGAKVEDTSEQTILETELASLEAELSVLNQQRTQKELEKKQLEAQKKALEARKQQIQAEIVANNEKIQQEIEQIEANQREFQCQEQRLAELEAQYAAKTKEASDISEQLNEKIDEILSKTEEEMNIKKDEMKLAMDEAQAKVESGEIEESEVEAYVAKKLGVSGFSSSTSQMFSVVNALNNQLKSIIQASAELFLQIRTTQTDMTNFSAQMAVANTNINNLIEANKSKKVELNNVNSDINLVDTEISILDQDISSLDASIEQKNTEIQKIKFQIFTEKNSDNVKDVKNLEVKPNLSMSKVKELTISFEEDIPVTENNPFVPLSFVATDYSNMVAALDAMSVTAENRINLVRDIIQQNQEENREAFK